MANPVDVKLLVKHLANGSFGENMCRICLAPISEFCENIFTSICKDGKEYCVADVLKELCDIKIADSDHYNVCPNCFSSASNAYKFYLNTKANEEMLQFYMDELERHVYSIDVPNDINAESLCISLPVVAMDYFDYDIKDIRHLVQKSCKEDVKIVEKSVVKPKKVQIKEEKDDDEEIVIIMNEKGQPSFFNLLPDGSLVKREYDDKCREAFDAIPREDLSQRRTRRKRDPMLPRKCPRCPVKYRFIAKLRAHMRQDHAAILYSCKICQAITEDVEEYKFHLKTHTKQYECDFCEVMFRKRDTMIQHIKEHKHGEIQCKPDYVCKICGVILVDEETLRSHTDLNHYKKYACYYCGRMYKGVLSFEKHVKKHEMYAKLEAKRKQISKRPLSSSEAQWLTASGAPAEPGWTCEQCGRGFRGERALMWHRQLHAGERPFVCEVCGRGFVSLNRRNQHALCAHTAPTRRCPLCPALFHLRSMVNSHIKKVHLSRHKRRSRARAAAPGPAPVPVPELSVALQAGVLELQARQQWGDGGYFMSEVGCEK